MSGPTLRISKDVPPLHLLTILRAKLREGQWAVRVGLPDGDNEPNSGLTLAELGAIHEYGLGHVPPRPFMATGLRFGKDRLREISKALLTQIVHGKRSIEEGLAIIGGQAVGMIQKTISANAYFEPLKDETIKRKTVNGKRGQVPLIDTGNMRQSITYTVQSREGTHAS